MLVLSRRANEKILFPSLGIEVQVVRIDAGRVRLGIKAPADIPVIREELAGKVGCAATNTGATAGQQEHQIRNRLNMAILGLHLVQRKLELGPDADIESMLSTVLDELQQLNSQLEADSATKNAMAADKRRALIVEDSKNEAQLLAGYLGTFGYEVFTVEDGLDALDFLASKTRPDVVLLDMNMPRMNGQAAIEKIRANPAHDGIKIFAVSGMAQQDANIETGPEGVDRWFRKPIQPEALVQELERHLDAGGCSA